MTAERCEREDELLDALRRGFTGAELEGHIAACAPCRDLRVAAGALLDDRAVAVEQAEVPPAGAMLWRIRMRARREADIRARQSLLLGLVATVGVAVALALAFFGPELGVAARQLVAPLRIGTPFLIAVAMWLLVAPIAGWIAVRQK